ncbi:hypothetical protein HK101_002240 [Irineochytrium annulatum]|nr:hypothetical protein HK101_002240 [Irineochytrium annulatum]
MKPITWIPLALLACLPALISASTPEQQPLLTNNLFESFVPSRIVAVGDFHGDFRNTVRVLNMAGIVDKTGELWIAEPGTFLVQTGDVVDRGPDTIALYAMMRNLTVQAEIAGGRVVRVLGNHEVMNMAADWRYVTKEDIASFGTAEKRRAEFGPEGLIGSDLRDLDIVTVVNGSVFVHGGVHPTWAEKGIDAINREARSAMAADNWRSNVFGGDGVLWYRGYAQDPEKQVCKLLRKALKSLGARRMVMGHTPQLDGHILSRCKGKAIVIDVGISSYYGGNCAALEIKDDVARALYCDGTRKLLS